MLKRVNLIGIFMATQRSYGDILRGTDKRSDGRTDVMVDVKEIIPVIKLNYLWYSRLKVCFYFVLYLFVNFYIFLDFSL